VQGGVHAGRYRDKFGDLRQDRDALIVPYCTCMSVFTVGLVVGLVIREDLLKLPPPPCLHSTKAPSKSPHSTLYYLFVHFNKGSLG